MIFRLLIANIAGKLSVEKAFGLVRSAFIRVIRGICVPHAGSQPHSRAQWKSEGIQNDTANPAIIDHSKAIPRMQAR